MVLVHGGGGRAFREWVEMWEERGYAALAMDLGGCGPDGERLRDGAGPDQDAPAKFHDISEGIENTWPYHAVAAVVRAVTVLCAQPEVDAERIGITGISWGGYLTCVTAGLDDRLKCAVPVYGCGFLHENSTWVPILKKMPGTDREKWISKLDPSNYLPYADVPMFWVTGTNDFAYPLDSYRKSYRAATGPRTLRVTVGMDHGHEHGWEPEEIFMFADHHLRGGEALPSVLKMKMGKGMAEASFESPVEVVEGELHFTADTGSWEHRAWTSVPAKLKGNRVRARLPAERPLACFFTITDARGATVSTEHRVLTG
jgi:dienelactone hydrolase